MDAGVRRQSQQPERPGNTDAELWSPDPRVDRDLLSPQRLLKRDQRIDTRDAVLDARGMRDVLATSLERPAAEYRHPAQRDQHQREDEHGHADPAARRSRRVGTAAVVGCIEHPTGRYAQSRKQPVPEQGADNRFGLHRVVGLGNRS